ncbi:MAG: ATP phosphoribosyltransferase regulatory subunit [Caldilineales bacterium]|nr:ATP phosphoribosyltransferase regulatory subunit [Caldilineales bacterium]
MDIPPPVSPPSLPRGVADYFGGAAWARRQAEATLRELARTWGYTEVIPPTFEFAETLATTAGARLAEELYRFLDRDGSALALRPDLTIPTARIAGSKLYDQPLPQRFFYAGPVFRFEEPRAGRQREFWQVGIELIGVKSADADAEVLAFAVRALQALDLGASHFTLGHLGYFHGLIAHLGLEPDMAQTLQSALDRKSYDDLADVAGVLRLEGDDRRAVLGLLDLAGPQGAGILARAETLARNETMRAAVAELRAVEARLDHYGVKGYFSVDLSDVRGMDYYTGITFKAYTAYMGAAIVNGGRYDNLIAHFGPGRPAVGCAFYLDRLLLAPTRREGPPPDPKPDLLVPPCGCGGYVTLADEARAAGLVVALALGPEPATGTPKAQCTCDGFITHQDGDATSRLSRRDWPDAVLGRRP